jgi:hypothetical protein
VSCMWCKWLLFNSNGYGPAKNITGRFEMLAFKSDVSHWRAQKELVGVSVR